MVPSVRGPHGDETAIHLAHLPVHRILWRTGSDQGDKPADTTSCIFVFFSIDTLQTHPLRPVQLYNFLGYLMDNFTPSSNERKISHFSRQILLLRKFSHVKSESLLVPPGNLISHIFRENEVCRDTEWERYFCYKNIEVPEIYTGPHLTFPLTVEQVVGLVEAFRRKKVGAQLDSAALHNQYSCF